MSTADKPRGRDPLLLLAMITAGLVVVVTIIAALTWRTPILHRDIHGHPVVATVATLDVTLTGLSSSAITVPKALVGIEFRNSTSLAHSLVLDVPVFTIDSTGSGDAGTSGVGDVVIQLPPHGDAHVALLPRSSGTYLIRCSGSPDGMQGTLTVSEPSPASPSAVASAAYRTVTLASAAALQRVRSR